MYPGHTTLPHPSSDALLPHPPAQLQHRAAQVAQQRVHLHVAPVVDVLGERVAERRVDRVAIPVGPAVVVGPARREARR
eukprot:3223932-Prymnesium_polylepis.1